MSYDKVVVDKRCTYYLLTWFSAEHQTKRFLDKIYEISWKTNDDDNVKNKNSYAHPCIGSSFVLMLSARVFVSGCRRRPLTNSLQLRVARLHTLVDDSIWWQQILHTVLKWKWWRAKRAAHRRNYLFNHNWILKWSIFSVLSSLHWVTPPWLIIVGCWVVVEEIDKKKIRILKWTTVVAAAAALKARRWFWLLQVHRAFMLLSLLSVVWWWL